MLSKWGEVSDLFGASITMNIEIDHTPQKQKLCHNNVWTAVLVLLHFIMPSATNTTSLSYVKIQLPTLILCYLFL